MGQVLGHLLVMEGVLVGGLARAWVEARAKGLCRPLAPPASHHLCCFALCAAVEVHVRCRGRLPYSIACACAVADLQRIQATSDADPPPAGWLLTTGCNGPGSMAAPGEGAQHSDDRKHPQMLYYKIDRAACCACRAPCCCEKAV
jgi:hypothetical protein